MGVVGYGWDMSGWPAASYEKWSETCDTLHGHSQVLGKLAARLAPPEPQLQHAALRLSARGWETAALPAPDGSGSLVIVLDLWAHEAVIEHSGGRVERVALAPNRSVGTVTREVLAAVRRLGGPVEIDQIPQEVPWKVPLDQDVEHAHYDVGQVADYFAAATQAAMVLAAFRAPYRGRSTPVNAWWGSFDLAVSLFSGLPAEPPSGDFIMRNAMDAQEASGAHRLPCPRLGGTQPWASTSWTGTTCAPARIRTPWRWSSPGLCSVTPALCAAGTLRSQPAQTEYLLRSSESPRTPRW